MKGMKKISKIDLKRELRNLFKSLDFVSKNFLTRRKSKAGKRDIQIYCNIYQQLGLVWEYLGSYCRHWEGYRQVSGGKMVCKICGKIKGTRV